MDRYIDADKLISNLKELPEQERIIYMGIYDCVRSQPTADVAEVVRCKDCTEWDKDEYECSHWYGFREDDYCSYGERIDGGVKE